MNVKVSITAAEKSLCWYAARGLNCGPITPEQGNALREKIAMIESERDQARQDLHESRNREHGALMALDLVLGASRNLVYQHNVIDEHECWFCPGFRHKHHAECEWHVLEETIKLLPDDPTDRARALGAAIQAVVSLDLPLHECRGDVDDLIDAVQALKDVLGEARPAGGGG